MARCLIILADGLRPDAVTRTAAPQLHRWSRQAATCVGARTVRPSVTVAALTSLATGVSPQTHGLVQPGLGFLARVASLRPLGRELARHGVPVMAVAGPLAVAARPIAWALAAYAGVPRLICAGAGAGSIAATAMVEWSAMDAGVLFVYLPDCDQAGHAAGWMSPGYMGAVASVDHAAGRLLDKTDGDLAIVLADHGGGGVTPTDHDAPDPINDGIPLMFSGPGVRRGPVYSAATILDVPPTLLHWFGATVPACYEGRVLTELFDAPAAVEVVA